MSMRTRLALVLAVVMIGPLLAAWAAIGVVVPRVNRAAADDLRLLLALMQHVEEDGESCIAVQDGMRGRKPSCCFGGRSRSIGRC